MARQLERATATRERLLEAGAALFAERGYDGVSQDEIVGRAGLTRGALYHHYGGKDGLFDAIYVRTQRGIAGEIDAAASRADAPWEALVAGCRVFVAAATDPAFRRIALVDAPRVLGWARWREVDAEHAMGTLVEGIRAVVASGDVPAQPVMPLVHALSGAMNELVLWVAASDDQERTLADALATMERLLEGLRARPGGEPGDVRPDGV